MLLAKDKLLSFFKVAAQLSKKSISPAVQFVRVNFADGKLIATAADENMFITLTENVEGANANTTCVLSAPIMAKLLKTMPNEFSMDIQGDKIIIKSETSKFELNNHTDTELPQKPAVDSGINIEFEKPHFIHAVKKVIFAVAADDSFGYNPLVAVRFEVSKDNCRLVGADGIQLAKFEMKPTYFTAESEAEIHIPYYILDQLIKLFETTDDSKIKLLVSGSFIVMQSGEISAIVRKHDLKYPDYSVVFERLTYEETARVMKDELLSGLERVTLLSADDFETNMTVEDGKLILEAKNSEIGNAREEVKADTGVSGKSIKYNGSLLINILKHFDDDEIVLSVVAKDAPILVTNQDDYEVVFMPLR